MFKIIRAAAWVALASLILELVLFYYYAAWLDILDTTAIVFVNLGIYVLAQREKLRLLKIVAVLMIIAVIVLPPLESSVENWADTPETDETSLPHLISMALFSLVWSPLVIMYGLALRPLRKKFGKIVSWASWTQIIDGIIVASGVILFILTALLLLETELSGLGALWKSVIDNFYFIPAFFEMLLLFRVSGKSLRKSTPNLTYRYTGIGLLIVSLLMLLLSPWFLLFVFWLTSFDFSPIIEKLLSEFSLFDIAMQLIEFALWLIILLWSFWIAVILIKTNKYSKQLLYLEYVWLTFLLFRAAYYLSLPYLISGLFFYYFLVKQDNNMSRLIKGKKLKQYRKP